MTTAAILTTTLLTVLLMVAFRPLAHAIGLIDKPGGRKRHVGEVPIIGGVAMYLGVVVGVALLPDMGINYSFLLGAGGLLVLIGVIDDRFGLPATVRLVAQLVAVLIMVFGAEIVMRDIGDPLWIGRIWLGPFSLVITALVFASVINAYNMADGMDGLAGSMVVVALLAIAYVAGSASPVFGLAMVVAGAVAAYLVFNLPIEKNRRVHAFMGDAGSTFLGFCVVWLTVSVCQGADRVLSPVNALWFAAVPVYDLFTCFVRRILAGRSPFDSGRDHLHHILRDSGMKVPGVVTTLVSLQVTYAIFGIASARLGMSESLVFTIWAVVGIGQLTLIRGIANLYDRTRKHPPQQAT